MSDNFFEQQPEDRKRLYTSLLEVTGSLSNLFSESSNPFLYYRAMENIFCKAFKADNLSRSDISVDAGKDGVGIGLKTFLQKNGNTFQKVAEFNKESYLFKDLKGLKLAKKVSEMRNERIKVTKNICGLSDMMYHLITRGEGHMAIYEEHMDLINIDDIKLKSQKEAVIHFSDKIHDYSFNMSKSTLFKRFDTSESKKIHTVNIEILKDPYEFLLAQKNMGTTSDIVQDMKVIEVEDYIVLPLYSPKTKKVEKCSGLNQWNAKGRARNNNEVYVPIPSWIHKSKEDFFSYNTNDNKTAPFLVKLPNGTKLSMRVAQQGGKALMSNPNSELERWILRDVLKLEEGELVTREQLDMIGIDSIRLSKLKSGEYALDFLKASSFEEFEEDYKKDKHE